MTRTDLFAAIRPFAPEQRFLASHVQVIDALADAFGLDRVGGDGSDWLSLALALIRKWEGCRLTAYPDPGTGGAPWTIGWGSITDSAGRPIQPGTTWTQAEADHRLAEHVAEFAREVDKLLGAAPTTAAQKAALVSFAYNVGADALRTSTLLRLHKEGDYAGAVGQFGRWNKAAGKVLAGLTKRRADEARLYGGGVL